jgi:hypothetical protein
MTDFRSRPIRDRSDILHFPEKMVVSAAELDKDLHEGDLFCEN